MLNGLFPKKHTSEFTRPGMLWCLRDDYQDLGAHPIGWPPYLIGYNSVYSVSAVRKVGHYGKLFRTNAEGVHLSEALLHPGYPLKYAPKAKV